MKRYEVTRKYIIQAQDETHLRILLFNDARFPGTPIDWYLVREYYKELPTVQRRAVKRRRNLWLATVGSQVRYLLLGK